MSESKKPITGYAVCQRMVSVIEAEVESLRGLQHRRPRGEDYSHPVHKLAQSCAVLQAEIRKTGVDADKAVDKLPAERQFELTCRMLKDWSPEHRLALMVYLEELGTKLL